MTYWSTRSPLVAVFLLAALAGCATPQEKLMSAAATGNEADLAAALRQNGDVNAPLKSPPTEGPCTSSLTALQVAVCQGHAGAVRLLMSNRADAGRPNAKGELPLVQAAASGKTDVVRALLDGGANPNVRDTAGQTPLFASDDPAIVQALLGSRADPNLTNGAGETPLADAARMGSTAKMELLLRAGAHVNARSGGQTALLTAFNADIVRLLLAAKADPNFTNTLGETPLLVMARGGKSEAVRLLLAAGARVDARGPGRRTPLMLAADADVARLLIGARADVSARDQDGETPLMHAARQGRAAVARVLLESGANIADKNNAGETVATAARDGRDSQTIALVREAMLNQRLAEADRAAAAGDKAGALAAYVAALPAMAQVGTIQERQLRLKILRLASGMPTAPQFPEAAQEHVVRADVYLKRGRSAAEIEQEMREALKLVPWWADGYFNIGLIQGNDGRYRDGISTLELFIAGAPNHPKVAAAREKIVEFKISQEETDKVNGLAGYWASSDGNSYQLSVRGDKLTLVSASGITVEATLQNGGALMGTMQSRPYQGQDNCTIPGQNHPVTGSLDRDGRSINLEFLWSTYSTRSHCVNPFGQPSICCLMCSKVCSGVNISGTNTVRQRLNKR